MNHSVNHGARISRCRAEFGIALSELACVIAVMAAEKLGRQPPSIPEVLKVTELKYAPFGRLVARGWLVVAGRDSGQGATHHRYRAHPRAWKKLGFQPPRTEHFLGPASCAPAVALQGVGR